MHRRITLLLIACLVCSAVAPAGVAAQTDDESFFGGLVSDDGADGFLNGPDIATTLAKVTSYGDRTWAKYTTDPQPATTYANETATVFNRNNESLLAFANDRLNASSSVDTFAVHFHGRDGSNATRYVVAETADGNYTSAEMVTPTAFNETNRSVDYHIRADWYVSQHAASELEWFVEEHAEPNANLTTTEKARLVSEYGGGLSSGLWA